MILPSDFDPETLILREASEAEKIKSWENNSEAWKGKLTVKQYIEQQTINGRQALTRDGRIRYWILTDGSEIFTSAETLQKPAVAYDGQNKTRVRTYGIAGVYTPPRFRRHGCASSLMRKLVQWLDSDDVICDFTVLWSAVGVSCESTAIVCFYSYYKKFYERFGWMVFDTKEVLIPSAPSDTGNATTLFREQIEDICRRDTETVLSQYPTSGSKIYVACLPTYEQAEWHFASEDYIASQLGKTSTLNTLTQVKGIMSQEQDTWCYWLHDFNADKLIILRLFIGDEDKTIPSLMQILQKARGEAFRSGLTNVSIWDPDPRIFEAIKLLDVQSTVLEEIENNIPCLRWKGGKFGDKIADRVTWQHREMYPWC